MGQSPSILMPSGSLYGAGAMPGAYGVMSPSLQAYPSASNAYPPQNMPPSVPGLPQQPADAAAPAAWPWQRSDEPAIQQKPIFFPDITFEKERVIQMNALQRAKYNLKHYTVDLSRAVGKGFRGDPDFSFSDFLLTSKIPYFLGGLALTSLFAMGGDRQAAARQGAGVALYILGSWAGNKSIDTAIKARYGVDMNQKFMKYDGTIENVITSPTFSRYDLIPNKDLAIMQKKMGIPEYVIAPRQAIKGTIQDLIPAERTSRAILANVVAAIGAGYLARSLAWNRILGGFRHVPQALSPSLNPNTTPLNRLGNAARIAVSDIRAAFADKLIANPREASPLLRRGVWGLLGLTALYSFGRVLTIGSHKQWERPGDGLALRAAATPDSSVFGPFRAMRDVRGTV